MAPEAGIGGGSSSTDNSPRRPSAGRGEGVGVGVGVGGGSTAVGAAGRGGKGKGKARPRSVVVASSTSASASANGGVATSAAAAATSGNSGGGGSGRSHAGGGGGIGRTDGGGMGDGEEGRDGQAGAAATEDPKAARIEQLRELTKNCLEENMSDTAAYYADKLVTFSNFDREAVLLLAKAQFACGAYLRTVHLLAQHRLLDYADNFGLRACHLAARSLRAAEKTEESVSLLEKVLGHTDDHAEEVKARAKAARSGVAAAAAVPGANGAGSGAVAAECPAPGVDVLAALCCLRGQAYAYLDNRPRAAVWLRTALEIDARCVEALQCLTRWHLLSIDEQASMVSGLEYGEEQQESWLHFLFKSQINRPPGSRAKVFGDLGRVGLGGNLDVLAAKAECCYEQNDAQQALEICRQVFRTDPHNSACLPVYLAAMVELKMKSQLFYTAHQLVEAGPKQAVSWFAVACYYHLLDKNELAQRYFLKSTKLDGRFAPAWIGFGNAFAAQEETDQAVSAYRTAARLFQGSHLALLYIGMEYVRTHNLALARNFLMGALALSPSDPLVLNEVLIGKLGVVHFASGEYTQARERFGKVLSIVEGLSSQALEAWESTVFNLGHCHRKLGSLDDAASCYLRARELSPQRHSVHSALALTHHLQGRHDDAIAGYHKALGLKPDDPFAAEMLKRALQESFSANEPCAGLEELFSKTSLDTNGNIVNDNSSSGRGRHQQSRGGGVLRGDDGAQFTPGLSPRSGRNDDRDSSSSVGTPYGGSGRGGGGGDRSFSFGAETPRTPRDSGAAAAAAAAAQSPLLAESSSSRMMMGGWRLDGEESGGGGGPFFAPPRGGGAGVLVGGGI
ncbi:Putative subunit of the Anaphase Promoting Complex [Ectocarpus siliculosus]|uniref:Subunit of the Anaphase Promoting Complex n=1 Tax=Ectocarpus siliculosus TaxID=2880 RepID=D8LN33_ECTSI|nr:Putative subunit of the Anaphase Promoting Complex [Ectocarpus siliculosus]|eukprot:CBN74796.1 Putative subunit of the Anaphase Promoting Complex [Ectocarpus siliculosus]